MDGFAGTSQPKFMKTSEMTALLRSQIFATELAVRKNQRRSVEVLIAGDDPLFRRTPEQLLTSEF
jgi:hypothetical protein